MQPRPSPAPALSVRSVHSQDIEQHTRLQDGWNLRYDQLDRGRFEGRFIDLRCGTAQVFVEITTRAVRQRGHLTPHTCCTAVAVTPARPVYASGLRMPKDAMLLAGEDADIELCTPSDFTLVGLVLEAQELRDTLALLDPAADRYTSQTELAAVRGQPTALAGWRERLLHIVQAAHQQPALLAAPAVVRQLHDDLLLQQAQLLCQLAPAAEAVRASASKRLVDQACDYVLARCAQPPSLLEVCRALHTSPRKLGYCFQDTLGMSPARFLKITRLNAVRRALAEAAPGASVYDIAARWGFWHFGHFSTDYRRQFSESPSQTLHRHGAH